MANAKGMALNRRYTHTQYPNILQLMWHFMSFCITPFFCPPCQKRLGDEGLAYFQNEAPDQKSQELVDRGILYGGFSSSPLWHLSLVPKNGGGVNWENPVLLSTRIFLEMSCGWAITVDICRYLILPSMVCLKLSKGCGFRWHEHWHLGSVSFEKSLKTVNISVYSCWCFSAFLAKVIAELFIWN